MKTFVSIEIGFPGGSNGKDSTCNVGDPGSIPGSGRYPGEGNGNLLPSSCLGNFMDRGAWQASPCGCKESDMTEWLVFFSIEMSLIKCLITHTRERPDLFFVFFLEFLFSFYSIASPVGKTHSLQHLLLCEVSSWGKAPPPPGHSECNPIFLKQCAAGQSVLPLELFKSLG